MERNETLKLIAEEHIVDLTEIQDEESVDSFRSEFTALIESFGQHTEGVSGPRSSIRDSFNAEFLAGNKKLSITQYNDGHGELVAVISDWSVLRPGRHIFPDRQKTFIGRASFRLFSDGRLFSGAKDIENPEESLADFMVEAREIVKTSHGLRERAAKIGRPVANFARRMTS